jgi:hypothetical protein
MARVGFEPRISAFERMKTVRTLDHAAAVRGKQFVQNGNIVALPNWSLSGYGQWFPWTIALLLEDDESQYTVLTKRAIGCMYKNFESSSEKGKLYSSLFHSFRANYNVYFRRPLTNWFHGAQSFLRIHQSVARSIQSMPSHPISLRYILISSSHLYICLPYQTHSCVSISSYSLCPVTIKYL